jgi:hypothetical protein
MVLQSYSFVQYPYEHQDLDHRAEHKRARTGAVAHLAVAVLADAQAGSGQAGATVRPAVAVHADAQAADAGVCSSHRLKCPTSRSWIRLWTRE